MPTNEFASPFDFDDDELETLNSKQFLDELGSLRESVSAMIDAGCTGFDISAEATQQRIERVQHDFEFFALTYFPHYIENDKSAFHEWVYSTLPEAIDKRGCKLAVAAPRGNAKSTLITQLFVMWCNFTERMWFNVIIMDAFDQAVMMLEAIKVEYESNPRLKQDFPKLVGGGKTWQAGLIITPNGRMIRVAGSGKRIRGWRFGAKRPDLVILDDIENDENVRKKEQRDKTDEWINKAVLKLGNPDGSMCVVYVGTILHYDSVLNRKIKSPMWAGHVFKAIERYPDDMDLWEEWQEILLNDGMETADLFYARHEAEMLKGAVVNWPSTQPLLMLMKIKVEDPKSFLSEYQNDPNDNENSTFSGFTVWVVKDRDWIYYGACDPSLGKRGKRGDPSAILVGGYDRKHGVLDVVEASIRRRVPDIIINDIIEFQRIYPCFAWVIETVQFQEFLKDEIVKRSAQAGVHVPARGVTPNVDKELRIESIEPHVSNGLIRVHQSQTTLIEQINHYPEVAHDDGLDALQMLWMAATRGAGAMPRVSSRKPAYRRSNVRY